MYARFPRYTPSTAKYPELKHVISAYLENYYSRQDYNAFGSDLQDVLDCYLLKKPVTMLFFDEISAALLYALLKQLRSFFFVAYAEPEYCRRGYVSSTVYISRFQNLAEIASDPVYSQCEDVIGILLGLPPTAVAEYYRRRGYDNIK